MALRKVELIWLNAPEAHWLHYCAHLAEFQQNDLRPWLVLRATQTGTNVLLMAQSGHWLDTATRNTDATFPKKGTKGWWARQDSNLRPNRYERSALTN